MRRGRRLASGPLLAMAITVLTLGSGGITAHAAVTTYTIGVDNATPASHLLMYTDFFPRGGTSVLPGDVIDFKWNTGSPDGFHTTTVLATGVTPNTVYADPTFAPAVPDADDGAGTLQENPAINAPSNPACGTVGTPCVYDGSTQLNSGAFPTAPGNDFYVTMNVNEGTDVTFICLIHPGMVGSVSVIAPGGAPPSTQATVDAAAAAQYATDTTEALAAAAAVVVPSPSTNADGSKTWNVQAGAQGPHEQVLEFFPNNFQVTAGDSVKWTQPTNDIHTVTFPSGAASAGVDFHQFVCEGGPPDTPAAAPPAPPCAVPPNFESHFTPAPAGPTTLADPTTVATSGVLGIPPSPFPGNYTFKVAGVGTYTYMCKVHDHMTATLAAVAKLPPSGSRPSVPQGISRPGETPPISGLVILGLVALLGIGAMTRRLVR